MQFVLLSLLSCLLTTALVESFATTATSVVRSSRVGNNLALSTTDETAAKADTTAPTSTLPDKLLQGDRYVASNRFAVRAGKEAKFEKRWATRKSRLAELDGFKYFHLMRRVTLDDDDGVNYDGGKKRSENPPMGNYVSLTVWENKGNFNTWRKGNAFKEAHGGTSIGAFMSTMMSSLRILRGAPKPAFYDGLLVQSTAPKFMPETVDGWRNVEVPDDGSTLPVECFVACNQFFVPKENAVAFEQRWKNRDSQLPLCEGFVAFSMMRRDAKTKTHSSVAMDETVEPTYVSTTIWQNRASFDKWRSGSNFSKVHGQQKEGEDKKKNDATSDNEAPQKPLQAPGPPMWSRPPKPIFYEGTLVISTAEGI